MAQQRDLTGQTIGRWFVQKKTSDIQRKGYKEAVWLCQCTCGTVREVRSRLLLHKTSGSRSCGCARVETLQANPARRTHGQSKSHPLYQVWKQMRQRCENPNNHKYSIYGARGIQVCERWSEFTRFLEDMEDTWTPDLTLDRINVDGSYSPENCRWATLEVQANNRRDNVMLDTPQGLMTLAEASRCYGVGEGTIRYRLRAGFSHHDAVTKPVRGKHER